MNKVPELEALLKSFNMSEAFRVLSEVSNLALKENWKYERYFEELLGREWTMRMNRKEKRLLKQSKLPEGKTVSTLQQDRFSSQIRKHWNYLISGEFVKEHQNVLAFGLPGRGKTHFLCALSHELIVRYHYKVRFVAVYRLVQELLQAKSELKLNHYLKRQLSFDVIVLDDIGYVQQSREEMEVFFTFLAECYEQKSLMITSNQNFSQWDKIFHDPMTAMAAIDRLVHHSVIIEFGGESFRVKKSNLN